MAVVQAVRVGRELHRAPLNRRPATATPDQALRAGSLAIDHRRAGDLDGDIGSQIAALYDQG